MKALFGSTVWKYCLEALFGSNIKALPITV